ncbi:aromatic acid exporter family protein [Streptomyces sp. NPDC050145]|uniref:aromatic acid exporter family protein n=1 Tax=Streptomyces sp. NPDC050145 TaxID=3365602 RepID=UPI003788CC55
MRKVWQRVWGNLWPVLQQSVAAALSWWLARQIFDHHTPLFAPMATLVALNTPVGGRGTNAVRVVSGVIAGVIVGGLAFRFLGNSIFSVGVAVLCALVVALALDGERITMAQAAIGAVISVASGEQAGIDRVEDALFGAGVALVFSQVLFPAHPLALLRRAEADTLQALSRSLELTATSLRRARDDDEGRWKAQLWDALRPVYTSLHDLGHTRDDALAAARRTPHWSWRQDPVRQETVAAGHLDLLGNSCLTLIRVTVALGEEGRHAVAPTVRGLSGALGALVAAPGSPVARLHATQWVLHVVQDRRDHLPDAVWASAQLVGEDILVFAGADAGAAHRAVNDGATEIPLANPPRLDWPTLKRRPRRES